MNKLQWISNQNTNRFIHENASENIVCEMAAILFRGKWVNEMRYQILHAAFSLYVLANNMP